MHPDQLKKGLLCLGIAAAIGLSNLTSLPPTPIDASLSQAQRDDCSSAARTWVDYGGNDAQHAYDSCVLIELSRRANKLALQGRTP
jgi:hypothetical protein